MPPSGTSTISGAQSRPTEYFVDPAPGSSRRWAIFAIGSLNFVLSMFYRVSTAVISPALVNDLGLSSGQLSDLSAVFFYAFAGSQIPIGVALDRVGSRITMAVLACAAVSGTLIFAMGQTFLHLLIGRILLGIGMSGNLMVLLALLAAWFPVNRFAFLSGVGSCRRMGNLLANAGASESVDRMERQFPSVRRNKYGHSRGARAGHQKPTFKVCNYLLEGAVAHQRLGTPVEILQLLGDQFEQLCSLRLSCGPARTLGSAFFGLRTGSRRD
jgi:hypothetical protein